MNKKLDELFIETRTKIYNLVQKNNIDINLLAFDLGVSREEFINNFNKRIDDFSFYLKALSLAENWEG